MFSVFFMCMCILFTHFTPAQHHSNISDLLDHFTGLAAPSIDGCPVRSNSSLFGTLSIQVIRKKSKSLRLPDSENLVSHRAAMSMLYLASSVATRALRLSGRLAPSRSRRVLTFHCAIVSSCLFLPS